MHLAGLPNRDKLLAAAGLTAASVWPVADLAAANADVRAALSISGLLWFGGLLVALTCGSLVVARTIGFTRASALAVLLCGLFFSYASFEPILRAILTSLHIRNGAAILYLGLLVVIAILAWRGTRAAMTARFIHFAAVAVVLSTFVFGVIAHVLGHTAAIRESVSRVTWRSGGIQPNIYHFIFDAMGRPDQIKSSLGLNLDEVPPAFAARAFTIAPHARATYLSTETSIGSMLSPGQVPESRLDISASDVVSTLREAGYRYHFYGEIFFFAACSGVEDRCLAVDAPGLSEFDITMLRKTAVYPVLKRRILAATSSRDLPRNLMAIATTPTPTPTYTLSYMTPPHPPFIFSADCKADQQDFNDFRAWSSGSVPRYGIAYRCVASATLQAVDAIILRDPSAVIIVSGDHGPMFLKRRGNGGDSWSPAALAERRPVFLAVRGPKKCEAGINNIRSLPELYPVLSSCLGRGA